MVKNKPNKQLTELLSYSSTLKMRQYFCPKCQQISTLYGVTSQKLVLFKLLRILWFSKEETTEGLKSSIFWNITPYSLLEVNRRFERAALRASCWFLAWHILQSWRCTRYAFFRNVGWLSPNCMALTPRRQNSENLKSYNLKFDPSLLTFSFRYIFTQYQGCNPEGWRGIAVPLYRYATVHYLPSVGHAPYWEVAWLCRTQTLDGELPFGSWSISCP
jgi:hypothetical protein